MRSILVTGANSYIGRAFSQYMGAFSGEYMVHSVSLRHGSWREKDFSPYDAVLHTVGLAHMRETAGNRPLYGQINRDLAVETARKARAEGVGQFLFLSSMSVYGMDEGVITPKTVPRPQSSYGRSKLEAEQLLWGLRTETFRVAILRPPMVYGEGCRGNYRALVRLAGLLPACPEYENRRSAISIEHLCAYMKETIDSGAEGVFCPQDPEYFCTCRMICRIAEAQGRRLPQTRLLNAGPALLRRFTRAGRKAFGDLVYWDEGQCSDACIQCGEVHRGGGPVCAAPDVEGL